MNAAKPHTPTTQYASAPFRVVRVGAYGNRGYVAHDGAPACFKSQRAAEREAERLTKIAIRMGSPARYEWGCE
jgi:hypothetical protein